MQGFGIKIDDENLVLELEIRRVETMIGDWDWRLGIMILMKTKWLVFDFDIIKGGGGHEIGLGTKSS